MIQQIKATAIILLLVYGNKLSAQRIDHTATFRTIVAEKYFRLHYDNDFFTASDNYYTQGITLELVHPAIKKFFLTNLLWKPFAVIPQYGVAANLFGYTPTSIASDTILKGDRPFSSSFSIKIFSTQADPVQQQLLTTALSIGVIGPWAMGYEIQYGIHKWLKNPLPHGWQHQIQNDLIINYQLNYEKQLLSARNNFLLNATAEARLGTLNNRLSSGLNLMAGRFNKRFLPIDQKKRIAEYYFYAQARVNAVGYDASLQGGLFNRNSPYTIPTNDISRGTFQADAGIIVNFKTLYLSYTQSFISREFRTGKNHRWGGISIGFSL